MYACFKCIFTSILILWWPHNSHEKTCKWQSPTCYRSIRLFVQSGLSWVIESLGFRPCKSLFCLLIHLLICVYCSCADVCVIVFHSFSDTALQITLCRAISKRRENKTSLGVGIRSLTSEFPKVLQEHAPWWSAVVNELCSIGQLGGWAGPRRGSALHLFAPGGFTCLKIIFLPFQLRLSESHR